MQNKAERSFFHVLVTCFSFVHTRTTRAVRLNKKFKKNPKKIQKKIQKKFKKKIQKKFKKKIQKKLKKLKKNKNK